MVLVELNKQSDAWIDAFSRGIADFLVADEEERPGRSLVSKEGLHYQYRDIMRDAFYATRDRVQNGFFHLMISLIELMEMHKEWTFEEIEGTIKQMVDVSAHSGAKKESIEEKISEGMTFQEAFGLTNIVMDRFYRAAWHLYEQGKYAEAADGFVFLTVINGLVQPFWMGLAASNKALQLWEPALHGYAMAALTRQGDPVPHAHAADCYVAIKEMDHATESLDLAIELSGSIPEYAEIKKTAEANKALLRKPRA